jgi:hypothetical protein
MHPSRSFDPCRRERVGEADVYLPTAQAQISTTRIDASRRPYVAGRPERIDGQLTLLGVTRPVSLTIVDYSCPDARAREQQRCKLDATAMFKRSDFGMTGYMAIISDEVNLAIHGVAGQVVD